MMHSLLLTLEIERLTWLITFRYSFLKGILIKDVRQHWGGLKTRRYFFLMLLEGRLKQLHLNEVFTCLHNS